MQMIHRARQTISEAMHLDPILDVTAPLESIMPKFAIIGSITNHDIESILSLSDVPDVIMDGDYATAKALLDAERIRLGIAVARESAAEIPRCQEQKSYEDETRRLGGIRRRSY